MASWLKVAEDLLEVVDRRAKLVVNELADERSDSQPSAPSGQQVKARRKKSKEAHLRQSSTDTTIRSNVEQEQQSVQLSEPDVKIDRAETYPSETPLGDGTNKEEEVSVEQLYGANKDTVISDIAPSWVAHTDKRETDNDTAEAVPVTENEIEITSSSTNDGAINTNSEDLQESSSSALMDKENETTDGDRPADANPNIGSVAEATPLKVDQVSTESETVERHVISDGQENESVPLLEPSPNMNKQQEHKTEPSPIMNKQQENKTESSPNMNKQQEHKTESSPNTHNRQEHKTGPTSVKVQDQLDEAQGLLKSAVSTGQSKEARLARVCAGLSSRLQEYKSENAQLEELLILERERATSYEAHIKQLQQDLSASKLEVARVESNMSEALAAKNSEIESLVGSMGALKKQASASEGKLASLQENMEAIMRNRELTETRMMQALREELSSAERRAEEERVAHNATKMAAVEREVELEHRAVEASNALARIQRTAEESTSRATELEHKVALLEVECASLTQELQDMEARNRRGQKKTSDEASQILQMQAWQEEVERARQGQRDAENKLSSLEAELQKMRVEMAGMKRDAEHYSRQEHMELEKRYRELTDLLYHKQTQLEAMASEKAAAEFQLEKEARRLQEVQVEAERTRASRRSAVLWEEDTDIKTLEDLPLHHRHMAGASMQLQRAAKFLDSGAVRATRFLWRYPVARILLLFYLVFVHFFLMYLLHRLQEQADDFASREVAASMGLGNSSLP